MKSTMEEKMKDKVSDDDRAKVLEAVKEGLDWMEENPEAEAEEYASKLKEVRSSQGTSSLVLEDSTLQGRPVLKHSTCEVP
jgi:ABC-type nitrate/sulfonate/bicarbonate transport system substrate-binding protein